MIEHFADEECYRAFIGVRDEGGGYKGQLSRSDGVGVRRQLNDRQRAVFAGGVLASQAVHLIINAPALACVSVEQVRFIGLRLQGQYDSISGA